MRRTDDPGWEHTLSSSARAVATVMEAWAVRADSDEEQEAVNAWNREHNGIATHPLRREVIYSSLQTEQATVVWQSEIKRYGPRSIALGEVEVKMSGPGDSSGFVGRFANLMEPIDFDKAGADYL